MPGQTASHKAALPGWAVAVPPGGFQDEQVTGDRHCDQGPVVELVGVLAVAQR